MHEEMFNIISCKGNANLKNTDILSHTQSGWLSLRKQTTNAGKNWQE
jgi:hypothetical protein